MIDRNPGVEERARLERDGYLVVRDFFGKDSVAELMKWTVELETAPEVPGRHWVYREDSVTVPVRRVIQRIENFCPYHTGFDDLIRRGSLARWSSALLGGPVALFKDKINFKMPGAPGFKAHQDQQAGWSSYAPLFLTAMVTLDAATLENGCLEIAAGRHRKGLIGADAPRRILYLTCNLAIHGDLRARYFADKHASFPPDVDRDREKTYVFRV
jgi:2-aminoethylphosphonate dioxygenase